LTSSRSGDSRSGELSENIKDVPVFRLDGNFLVLWGEPVLGAKKERETKEERSYLDPAASIL